jgi:hypothetical protein
MAMWSSASAAYLSRSNRRLVFAGCGYRVATFAAYTLFLKRLSKVMSVPIAKGLENLARVGSLRARGTFFGRPAETIAPNRCDS